jgi:hypothetical protein
MQGDLLGPSNGIIFSADAQMIEKHDARTGILVAIFLFGLATLFWFAQVDWVSRPAVAPADTPAVEFSAERAESVLARILAAERPHPVSTTENAAVRARILGELSQLHIPARIHGGFACNSMRSVAVLTCASVNDIVAEVVPGRGRAIVLMAHYDSVPAGPGAADDESSVATIIETARALKTQLSPFRHPVLALFTDGEEAGMLGAAAFLQDPNLRARVGVVVNAEARGNHGRSLLFQTSPGNGPLIDKYAKDTLNYAASSLYQEIYRVLPNDTDLTLFIGDGFPSFNFAYTENVAHYHTALDTRANLDPQSVQQQGDNLLALTRGLEEMDFAGLKGEDEVYVDLLGRVLLHIPSLWVVPLSLAAFATLLAATFLSARTPIAKRVWVGAFLMTPSLVLGTALAGWVLHTLAQEVSGMPDPSSAYPASFRVALALASGALTLFVSRLAPLRAAAAACWLWLSGLGVVVAFLLPGFAPYFLVPSVVAAMLLVIAAMSPRGWDGYVGQGAVLLSAIPALLLWVGLGAAGETVMGLKLHPLVTVPIAIGLTALLPLFAAYRLPVRIGGLIAGGMIVGALCLSVLQGREPAFSPTTPQRLNITYVEENGRAQWAVDALAPIPASLRHAANFGSEPRKLSPFAWSSSYVAPAGVARDVSPVVQILLDQRDRNGRRLSLALHGSNQAQQMFLIFYKPRGLKDLEINGWHFSVPPQWGSRDRVVIACMSRDCASMKLTVALRGNAPLNTILGENRFTLPSAAATLLAARPNNAVPSQNGDGTLLINHLVL